MGSEPTVPFGVECGLTAIGGQARMRTLVGTPSEWAGDDAPLGTPGKVAMGVMRCRTKYPILPVDRGCRAYRRF